MQFLVEMILLAVVSFPVTKGLGAYLVHRYKLNIALKALEASVIYDAEKWQYTGDGVKNKESGLIVCAAKERYGNKILASIKYNEHQRLDMKDIPWLWRRRLYNAVRCRGRMAPKQIVAALKPQTPLVTGE